MSDQSFKGYKFNIIRQRGSPTKVTLSTGHEVEKQDFVYFEEPNDDGSGPGKWQGIKCAQYDGEHFIYLDPLYSIPPHQVNPEKAQTGRGHWFAMCTCGSPAVVVSPGEALYEQSEAIQLMVCFLYHKSLRELGVGSHADQQGRREWT